MEELLVSYPGQRKMLIGPVFWRETDSPSASRWMTNLWEEAVLFMCEMELAKE